MSKLLDTKAKILKSILLANIVSRCLWHFTWTQVELKYQDFRPKSILSIPYRLIRTRRRRRRLLVGNFLANTGYLPIDQKFRKFWVGCEWNRHFPKFLSEILGVPRQVDQKLWEIGMTRFCSRRSFLLGPNFSEP